MNKQRAEPTTIKPLKPARELASMVAKLPKEERLRLEGIIVGIDMAHKDTSPTGQPPKEDPCRQVI